MSRYEDRNLERSASRGDRRGERSGYESRESVAKRPTHLEVVMGHVVEVAACCVNPADCDRAECWRPVR